MKVLVTGANSLLGRNVIVELLQRGCAVRGMVRSPNRLMPDHSRLEEYIGNITEANALNEAARGCDAIIHVAANTSQHSQPYAAYAAVNIDGTRNVLEAARKYQIKRIVLVSSANAFGYGTEQQPGTEESKFCTPFTESGYARSKYEAQIEALQSAERIGGHIVVVNPTFMIGRYDSKPSSGKIVVRGYGKRVILVPPGGKNFIAVRDVAGAIYYALILGKHKECYLLAGKNMRYREFYKKINEVTGQRSLIITIPKFLLLLVGIIGSALAKCGIRNILHYNNMKILCIRNYYSGDKAVRELRLEKTPMNVAIADALEWFIETGMLKPLQRYPEQRLFTKVIIP